MLSTKRFYNLVAFNSFQSKLSVVWVKRRFFVKIITKMMISIISHQKIVVGTYKRLTSDGL